MIMHGVKVCGLESHRLRSFKTLVNVGFFLCLQGFSCVYSEVLLHYKVAIFRNLCNTNATRKSHIFYLLEMPVDSLRLSHCFQVNGIPIH